MAKSGISYAVGVAGAFAWMANWVVVRRACGIPVLIRTQEERAAKKQRLLQMGKLRYILIVGVLGNGFVLALGIAIAFAFMTKYDSANWGEVATLLALYLVTGCIDGVRTWNALFRNEVPFPPFYPPPK